MSATLIPIGTTDVSTDLQLRERLEERMRDSRAASTWRAYDSDWRHFAAWCAARGEVALPASPLTLAAYLDDMALDGFKVSTMNRRLSAIKARHEHSDLTSPTTAPAVRRVWLGIRRQVGTAQRAVSPATTDVVRAMAATLPTTTIGHRDRALLTIGMAGAFRRSELVALDVADLRVTDEGLRVWIARSKTDQEGAGREVGILPGTSAATCPVRALAVWLDAAGVAEGPVFRPVNRHGTVAESRLTGKAVALVVKRAAERAGLDPSLFSGHSLRAGHATAAAAAGAPEWEIQRQTGHKSAEMLRRYIRSGQLFQHNSSGYLGL